MWLRYLFRILCRRLLPSFVFSAYYSPAVVLCEYILFAFFNSFNREARAYTSEQKKNYSNVRRFTIVIKATWFFSFSHSFYTRVPKHCTIFYTANRFEPLCREFKAEAALVSVFMSAT